MGVKKGETRPPRLVKDFWPRFHTKSLVIICLLQLALIVVVGVMLYALGLYDSSPMTFGIGIVGITVTSMIVTLLIFAIIIRPSKDLFDAIVHISGEPTTTTPPNPNDRRYAQNGFKEILQTLYELAVKKDASETVNPAQPSEVAVATPSIESLLRSALNETICGFVVMNHDRTITFSNKSAPIRIDQNGVSSLDLIFPDDDSLGAWLDQCEQSAVRSEKSWTRLADKLPDHEDRRFFDVFASYDKGAETETVITLIDRTKLYSVGESELDFIAFAAHELRGPITVIRGYLDVLEDELGDSLQADHHELFRRLTVSANRLSGYINNILNTSRYDRRHLQLHLTESKLSDVYDIIKDDMQMRAGAQSRALSVAIPTDLPTIPADSASLSEVMANLIDNAIKYSNEGGAINVTAAAKGDMVELSIEDHGIGMPGSVVSNLFQKFYRSHRSRETVAGTGIGLYISKAIVESHGGKIGVRSEEGRGSTFIVSLPTFASVADKLKSGDNSNKDLIGQGDSFIKNHSMYRG